MSFMSSWVPGWVEGLYEIVSNIGKVIWMVLKALYVPITVIVAIAVAAWDFLSSLITWLTTQLTVAWSVLSDSSDAMASALQAGWPASFANAVAYCNTVVPVTESVIALGVLTFLWVVMGVLRIVKSCIPTIG